MALKIRLARGGAKNVHFTESLLPKHQHRVTGVMLNG